VSTPAKPNSTAPADTPPAPVRTERIPHYDRQLANTSEPPSTRVTTPLGLLEITVCEHDRLVVNGWFTINRTPHTVHAALKLHRTRGWLLCPTGCEKNFAAMADDVRHQATHVRHRRTGNPASPKAIVKAAIVIEETVREWAATSPGRVMLTRGAKRGHAVSMRCLEHLIIAADRRAKVAGAEARKARREMRALDKQQAAREQASAQSAPAKRT
jgi:hypothetical protein